MRTSDTRSVPVHQKNEIRQAFSCGICAGERLSFLGAPGGARFFSVYWGSRSLNFLIFR